MPNGTAVHVEKKPRVNHCSKGQRKGSVNFPKNCSILLTWSSNEMAEEQWLASQLINQ